MELKQLEAFVSIATLRNFSAAANRLNITQPAISLRLNALEQELGTPLFDRSGSKIQLTGPGLELLHYAEQIIDMSYRLKATALGETRSHQKVRIGTTDTIANSWLSELVAEIINGLQHLTFEIITDTTRNLRERLLSGEIDVAFLMGPVHEKGIRNLPLKTYESAWVAGERTKLPKGILTLDQIAPFPIITYARDSATYTTIEELFRMSGLWPVRLNSCSSTEVMIRTLVASNAIGVISTACLVSDRGLRRLRCEVKLPDYEFCAAYHLDSVGRVGMAVAERAQKLCQSF
ncbi:LysR family transcriptional regulator [Microvirga lotononidis]|uniref:Transcriptional regulator n=1 Tax=Microvirga lotononidis TaxID=864069 RepID=I4YR12_9HYPH|nr:LysR family transcriptional regulator [Microvirga lotononidis]EIM26404.1 transcriptional regulator [Microvirga lotononidis]WQO30767.1 LysR family transcriptional regulator [Microvirga lotononidis]